MDVLYFIAAFIVLLLVIKMKRKSGVFLKSALLFLFIILVLVPSFIWDNFQPAHAAKAMNTIKSIFNYQEDKTQKVFQNNTDIPIIKIKEKVILDAPFISQLPELPRGCEVTSLAMMLNDAGVQVTKLTLAKEIKKDSTAYSISSGKVFFGNPNDGFVGNMFDLRKPGLGVYHKPISELAEKYLPGRVQDLSGADFDELKIHLSDNRPVWVVVNTSYQKLDESLFQTWNTPSGAVKITYKEHSVLLTGYDREYVYFNDPLTGVKNKKAPISDFEESWVQMGRQAITYLPISKY
jgi:uncharacterized protein YvpB